MAQTANLGLPLDTHGTVALKQTVEGGFKKLDTIIKALQDELPTPVVGDIGKVVKVISDGAGGAKLSLEADAT